MLSSHPLTFGYAGEPGDDVQQWFASGFKRVMSALGHSFSDAQEVVPRLVLNFINPEQPRSYRRRAKATFVASVVSLPAQPNGVLRATYPLLVRSLSNLVISLISPDDPRGHLEAHFVTLEQGHYAVPHVNGDDDFFARVYERLNPLASARLVIDNVFNYDLPEALWSGDDVTSQIAETGRRLGAMDLLPAPFPIHELLTERDLDQVRRLYGIGGLSYGNISARARHDRTAFWMSASGVDKSSLTTVGRDILLVTGFDAEREAMLLSVPASVQPRRVSVDAIEHYLIYAEHPEVNAIVHVHAWMDGIASTEMNYPCGTWELAQEVAGVLRQEPDPGRAIIGLTNHGLTITGLDLPDILSRIEDRIVPQVPMA